MKRHQLQPIFQKCLCQPNVDKGKQNHRGNSRTMDPPSLTAETQGDAGPRRAEVGAHWDTFWSEARSINKKGGRVIAQAQVFFPRGDFTLPWREWKAGVLLAGWQLRSSGPRSSSVGHAVFAKGLEQRPGELGTGGRWRWGSQQEKEWRDPPLKPVAWG